MFSKSGPVFSLGLGILFVVGGLSLLVGLYRDRKIPYVTDVRRKHPSARFFYLNGYVFGSSVAILGSGLLLDSRSLVFIGASVTGASMLVWLIGGILWILVWKEPAPVDEQGRKRGIGRFLG
jgi:hypothetical protein